MPRTRQRTIDAPQAAVRCARLADQHKADDVVILDVRGISQVTDYFVIASGLIPRQLKTIAREIEKGMASCHATRLGVEGINDAHWVLLDYGDIVVHLFLSDLRKYYDLEMLWGDAPTVEWRG